MSGNHNQAQTTHSEPPSELDIEQMYSWSRGWNKGWMEQMEEITLPEFAPEMAQLCHDIHKRAFYDGFAARLSGVKDE